MHLTKGEEKTLAGEEGETRRRAIEILVALGDIYGSEKLVDISSAQVSGASFKTISTAGTEFVEEFSRDSKVSVKSTLNPLGMDREKWKEMGIANDFAEMQLRIVRAYEKMGIEMTCTCTPYFVGNRPERNRHIAWAESSAVVFANSVLGAKTNKEGGPSALAAAVIGKTPYYGLHIDDNRLPRTAIKVEIELLKEDYTLLGHAIGRKIGNDVPLIVGISPEEDEHKALGAAMAASGAASMYRFDRDPSACSSFDTIEESVSIDREILMESKELLSTTTEDVDIVTLGCPHLSVKEMTEIANELEGRSPRKDLRVWFCVSRGVADRCPKQVEVMNRFGTVACDTCMVVSPLESFSKRAATDSAKAAVYLPTLCKQQVFFSSRKEILELISE